MRNFSVLMKLLWYLKQIRPDQYEVCLLVGNGDGGGGHVRCSLQQHDWYILKFVLIRTTTTTTTKLTTTTTTTNNNNNNNDTFDELLRTALGHLTNCDLSDSEWIQATLPVRDGGLGVRPGLAFYPG